MLFDTVRSLFLSWASFVPLTEHLFATYGSEPSFTVSHIPLLVDLLHFRPLHGGPRIDCKDFDNIWIVNSLSVFDVLSVADITDGLNFLHTFGLRQMGFDLLVNLKSL